jgi:diguanylate cyclase (GGDEF)-like protein
MPAPRKILLVDDDPLFAGMIALLFSGFRSERFILDHAADQASGRERLRSGEYALCLLDYHLGDGDGLSLLREATAGRWPTPIVFLSGSTRDETDLAAMEAGALDFLAKGELTPRGLERAVCYALKVAESLARLQNLATHDELTGAANRREIDRRLQEAWHHAQRMGRSFAVVMIDVDDFKSTNDEHGHPAGDAVLRHLVAVIQPRLRPEDALGRYGGDEFCLLLTDTDRDSALAVVTRLQAGLRETPCRAAPNGEELPVRISAGVAAWPERGATIEALVAAADAELYAAKRQVRRLRETLCA